MGPCLCGDTYCPYCGGADETAEIVATWIEELASKHGFTFEWTDDVIAMLQILSFNARVNEVLATEASKYFSERKVNGS